MTPPLPARSPALGHLLHAALLAGAATVVLLQWVTGAGAGATAGPDVTVITLDGVSNFGASGGIRAFSVGTTSCNIGDQPLWWCDEDRAYCDDTQHPVIAQNLYRLADDRFEQIGMSWLKHGFFSTNQSLPTACGGEAGQPCGGPASPFGGDRLEIGCTDAYSSVLNGGNDSAASPRLGARSEVEPTTGAFPYPYTNVSHPSPLDQRLQVLETDLDPTVNGGARYWVEGQYVTADDATAGNGLNNASHREVTVAAGSHDLSFAGETQWQLPAIAAWPAVDPSVELVDADFQTVGAGAPPVERFHVARKLVHLGGPAWRYLYAIHNMNSERAAHRFTVELGGPTAFSSAGFSGVVHHSGEPYAAAAWTIAADDSTGSIEWFTDAFAANPNANALRWGTLFTFWFDATGIPFDLVERLDLFTPGTPESIMVPLGPALALFADGFESGDPAAWSSTSP